MIGFRGTYDQRGIRRVRKGLTYDQIAELTGLPLRTIQKRFPRHALGVSRLRNGRLVVSRDIAFDWIRRTADRLESAIFILATEVDE